MASDAESSVITQSFRFFFHFLLIVKLRIKMFTGINLVQTRACVISIGLPSWFKTEIFPTIRHNQSYLLLACMF